MPPTPATLPLLLALGALAGTAGAQDSGPFQGPVVLQVLTRDMGLIEGLTGLLQGVPHRFDLPEETGCFRYSIRWEEQLASRAVEQSASDVTLEPGIHSQFYIEPAVALRAYATELAALRRTWEPRIDVILQQAGYPVGFGKGLCRSVVELLPALASIEIRVQGDPYRAGEQGLTVLAALTPAPDTPLHDYLQALAPNASGVRRPTSPGAPVDLAFSLDPERLQQLYGPFAPLEAERNARNEEERRANHAEVASTLRTWDGTAVLRADRGSLVVVMGARQPAEFGAILFAPERLERLRQVAERQRRDVEHVPAAFTHRDVAVLATRSATDADTGGLPNALRSYAAVAGDCVLFLGGQQVGEQPMRDLIDRALDPDLPRAPLVDGAVLQADLDLEPLMAMLPVSGGLALGENAPRRARLVVHKTGITLNVRLELR